MVRTASLQSGTTSIMPMRFLIVLGTVMVLLPLEAATAQDRHPPKVIVTAVERAPYAPILTLTGEVQARKESVLSFLPAGRVISSSVEVGDVVEAGAELARLDPARQEADVLAAQAGLSAAVAQLEQVRLQHDRVERLFELGNATASSFDDAVAAWRTAQESVIAAEARLSSAQRALDDTILHAPSEGIVTTRSIDVGQIVQPAQPAFVLAENGARDAVFDVHERALLAMPETTTIALHLAVDASTIYTGVLREISPSLDPHLGTVRVRVAIEAGADAVPLGATIIGTASAEATERIILPVETLASLNGNPAVWVVDPDTLTVSAQAVSIVDVADGAIVLDQEALPQGALVVLRGPRALRDGLIVTPMEETAQ